MQREDPNDRRLRDIKKLIMIGVPLEEINRLYPSTSGFGARTKITTPRNIVQYEAEHGEINISDFGRRYGRIITGKDGTIRLSMSGSTANNSPAGAAATVSRYGRKRTVTRRNNFNYANENDIGNTKQVRLSLSPSDFFPEEQQKGAGRRRKTRRNRR